MAIKALKTGLFALAVCLILFSFSGCGNVSPLLHPEITPPSNTPLCPASPSPTPDVTPGDTPEPVSSEISATDALGNLIYDADHFQQYLQFRDIRIYEDGNDTFLDCIVVNDYPEALCCAVNIQFCNENDEMIANGSLQMPDGSFMLSLPTGETPLYATILTDISLSSAEFELIFDPGVGVKPIQAD